MEAILLFLPMEEEMMMMAATTTTMEKGRGRASRGKQRIEMRRIIDKSRRRVTFSKRRQGLFKKAEELDILCGSRTAIVSVSDSGNVFTAGCPSLLLLLHGSLLEHDVGGSLETMGLEELGRKLAALKDIQRSVELAMEKKKEEEEAAAAAAAAGGAAAAAAVSDCLLLVPAPDQATETPPPPPAAAADTTLGPAGGVSYVGEEESLWLSDIEFDGLFDVADFLDACLS